MKLSVDKAFLQKLAAKSQGIKGSALGTNFTTPTSISGFGTKQSPKFNFKQKKNNRK